MGELSSRAIGLAVFDSLEMDLEQAARSELNAIMSPLGEIDGMVSLAGSFVIRRTLLPSEFIK